MTDEGTCDVSLGEYDGDAPRVFHSSIVKARKTHTCYECKGEIQPGQKYERVSGLWDEWSTYRFCLPCSEIALEFSENGRWFGILWDGMEENWENGAHLQACLNRLTTVSAKEKLAAQWRKWKKI